MYLRDQRTSLYREAARIAWARYRPRGFEFAVGWALLRDSEVPLGDKIRSGVVTLGVVLAWLMLSTWVTSHAGTAHSNLLWLTAGAGTLVSLFVVLPLAMIRMADPEHIVRVRLQRLAVIPLKRR